MKDNQAKDHTANRIKTKGENKFYQNFFYKKVEGKKKLSSEPRKDSFIRAYISYPLHQLLKLFLISLAYLISSFQQIFSMFLFFSSLFDVGYILQSPRV
jgi:hypothetical protein